MGTAGAIYNVPQAYGNGEIILTGSFIDNGTQAQVAHGVGWQVVRGVNTGCYKITLAPPGLPNLSYRSLINAQSSVCLPASDGDSAAVASGSSNTGDLQSDGVTLYQYVSDGDGNSINLPVGQLLSFIYIMSTSSINR